MANRISTIFDFSERGSGLKKIKADVAGVEGSFAKLKTGFKSSIAEFRNSNVAQGAAVAGLSAGIGKAIGNASDLAESTNAMTTTFGEASTAIEQLGEDSVESYGMSERAFFDMSVALSGFATQATKDGGDVAETVDEMATRIADFASVHNLEMSDAVQKFQSALAGEAEAMRRYGIDVSAATVKNHAYATGIADVGDELTEAEKVQSRYSLLLQETDQWAGDFANTSDSLANQQRILSAEMENMSAELGQTLAPAVATVVGGLNDMLGALEKIGATDALSLSWVEPLGKTIGEVLSPWNKQAREKNNAIVQVFEAATEAAEAFDDTLLDGIDSYDEAKAVVDDYTASIEDEAVAHDAGIQIIADWGREKRRAAEAAEEAERALDAERDALRENAREATYTAEATEELGRIQEINKGITDRARAAYEKFLQSIKFTRDEVGALKREIDDEQAWLNLQNAMDSTIATMDDAEVSARDQRLAVLDLKDSVIEYAESINLPDRVVTQLVAQIDAGKVSEVEALLSRWGNGVTLPIKPVVINTGTGTNIRVDSNGNVRAYDSGGVVPGPKGSPQVAVVHGGETIVPTHKSPGAVASSETGRMFAGGGGITVIINGGYLDDRTIAELERRLEQWRRGAR